VHNPTPETPATIEVIPDFSQQEVRLLDEISKPREAVEPAVIPGAAPPTDSTPTLTPEQTAHAARMALVTQSNLDQAEAKRLRRQARNLKNQ
jgi:hypothetical protein